jgi:hypothetical protein
VDSYADWKSVFAGYTANCSANPYLTLQVGEGKNEVGLIKYIDDAKNLMPSTLNPKFKASYPMDLTLPDDNQLDIQVWSKGNIKDHLVGSTSIDLEDRYYGDSYNQGMISLKMFQKYYIEKLDGVKKESDKGKRLRRKIDEVNRLKTQIENFEPLRKIEFRQLLKEGKNQPQGTMQLWTDIFPSDARVIEYSLKGMAQNRYELRLIIWNTYNVPKIPGVSK